MGVKFANYIYFLVWAGKEGIPAYALPVRSPPHTSVQEEFEILTRVGGYPWFNPPAILVGENLNLPLPTWLSKPWCCRPRLPASCCSREGSLIAVGVNLRLYSKIHIPCWVSLTPCHTSFHSPDPRAASQAGCSFLCCSWVQIYLSPCKVCIKYSFLLSEGDSNHWTAYVKTSHPRLPL